MFVKKNGSVWLRNYGVRHTLKVKYSAPETELFYKYQLVKKYKVRR